VHNVFPWDIFEAAPNMSPVKILELDISFFSLCSSLNWRVRPLVQSWACYQGIEKYGTRGLRFQIIHFSGKRIRKRKHKKYFLANGYEKVYAVFSKPCLLLAVVVGHTHAFARQISSTLHSSQLVLFPNGQLLRWPERLFPRSFLFKIY